MAVIRQDNGRKTICLRSLKVKGVDTGIRIWAKLKLEFLDVLRGLTAIHLLVQRLDTLLDRVQVTVGVDFLKNAGF